MTNSNSPGKSKIGHDRCDAFTGTNKKQAELAFCWPVVGRINHDERTDYAPVPATEEPADVLFRSRSSRHPDREVQVVTAPPGSRSRIDSDNVRNFKRELCNYLGERGLNGGPMLTVALTPKAMRSKRPQHIALIGALIIEKIKEGAFSLMPDELRKIAPEVYSVAGYIGGLPTPGHGGILWDIFRFEDFSRTTWDLEGWVRQAIATKSLKYPQQIVARLTLVIGLTLFVGGNGEARRRLAFRNPQRLPFKKIWVSSWDGMAIRLKP
ncbi:MAG TPA: hypothetical protein VEO19_01935 [Terriglobia bacterium]|nr:hypothetical protein [Terriglobia bacterium]